MSTERPDDIVVTEITVDAREQERIDHGKITQDGETYHAEASAELEILEDGRTRIVLLLGNAELTLVYDRESEESAERAAVLLTSGPLMITQVEEAYDAS